MGSHWTLGDSGNVSFLVCEHFENLYSIATRIPPGQKSSKTGLRLKSWSKMRFLTILKFLKIHQKINFCSVRGVTGKSRGQPAHPTKCNFFFAQSAVVGIQFHEILKFLKIHQKINFWWVRGVTGKARSQEMSIFEVFEHLNIFENFCKFWKVGERQRKFMKSHGFFCRKSRGASFEDKCEYTQIYTTMQKCTQRYTQMHKYA